MVNPKTQESRMLACPRMVGVAVIPISVIVYYILTAISWLLLYCQCPMTAILCVLGVCPSSNPDAHRHACFGECVSRNSRIQNCESLPAMCEMRESNPSFNTYTHERCTSIAASFLARPNAASEIPNLGKVARTWVGRVWDSSISQSLQVKGRISSHASRSRGVTLHCMTVPSKLPSILLPLRFCPFLSPTDEPRRVDDRGHDP